VGRTHRVAEALIAAVLEQKVTGKEAWLGWRTLVAEFGERSPGPPGTPSRLRVFPSLEVWRQIPSWKWHSAGVDSTRSSTVLRVIEVAARLEALCVDLDGEVDQAMARQLMRSIQGIGVWTVAETAQRALGDADAVSYRDYHLAHEVVYALTGDRYGTDEQMARLLLPFAGHRYRIQRLVELSDRRRPRRGPRMTIYDMRGR
jgi:3-methyladenine DNA glycosylase/8-oxoguanine DNA glycosylase